MQRVTRQRMAGEASEQVAYPNHEQKLYKHNCSSCVDLSKVCSRIIEKETRRWILHLKDEEVYRNSHSLHRVAQR